MRDNKAFASLTSGLLARKGQARPAMRPQGFAQATAQADDLGWNDMGHDAPRVAGVRLPIGLAGPQALPPRVAAEVLPEVLRQQDEIIREFAAPAEPEAAPPTPAIKAAAIEAPAAEPVALAPAEVATESAPVRKPRARRPAKAGKPAAAPREAGRKAAFTLRLETERHLLLRLACAVQNRSAQQIVTQALDRLLADLPEVARLAAALPAKD